MQNLEAAWKSRYESELIHKSDHFARTGQREYSFRRRLLAFRDFFEPLRNRPLRVLDLGCGPGLFASFYLNSLSGVQVTGVDYSEAMLVFARAENPGATFLQADARALPLTDASFDVVLSVGMLQNISELDRVLAEAFRVTVPGGKVFFNTINSRFLLKGKLNDHRAYSRTELETAFRKAGFENIEVRPLFLYPAPLRVLHAADALVGAFDPLRLINHDWAVTAGRPV